MSPSPSSSEMYSSLKYFALSFPVPFVAHVETNRPEKLNAFCEAMWLEMGGLFRTLSHDPEVRVILMSGKGEKGFCSGLDVMEASQGNVLGNDEGKAMDGARTAQQLRRHIDEFQGSISEIEKCEKPVIALLHGISYGLAIDIACSADIRFAATSTRFSVKEVDIGLAADIGSLARLPKAVASASWVRDVCLSARIFGADEALRQGFVSRVFNDREAMLKEALELAGTIASKSPVAVMGTKELLKHSRDHSVAENLRYTAIWNSAMLQSDDVKLSLLSGIKKTKPTFAKL